MLQTAERKVVTVENVEVGPPRPVPVRHDQYSDATTWVKREDGSLEIYENHTLVATHASGTWRRALWAILRPS